MLDERESSNRPSNSNQSEFPMMNKYLKPVVNPGKRKMVGREDIVNLVLATLNRIEISNVALVGDAGTGKTTVAYGVAARDTQRDYYEVRLSLMTSSDDGADGTLQMGSRLTQLVDEVVNYQNKRNRELVLFMDEFHLIMEVSPAAMEAIKPVLANSGARGLRIIVATTYEEYNKYVRPNEALTERLERISLPELSFDETLEALRNYMAVGFPGEYVDEHLLRRIIEVTDRALPSQHQPRKSLRLLDAMGGWHRTFHDPLNEKLLAKMIKASVGTDVDYQVDVDNVEKQLNAKVFDQTLAVQAMAERLYVSVADLNDRTRPRGSFLFTGSTGVGKTALAKTMSQVLYGSESNMIRFDMSEFSEPRSVTLLKDSLTEAVWERPSSIILLDEIDKAASACSKLMLQVLDDARLTDEHGREISFKDTYIIFTTNAGANVYEDLQAMYGHAQVSGYTDDQERERQHKMLRSYMKLITRALRSKQAQFPSELLGRFDQIVPFAPIGESTRNKICDAQLHELSNLVYQKHGVSLHIDKDVKRFIVKEHIGSNETTNGGGREIRRRIDAYLLSKISEVIIKWPELKDLGVRVKGQMAIDLPNDKEGNAEIEVGRWSGSSR